MEEDIKVVKTTARTFTYATPKLSLQFTLNVDTKEELEGFIVLLKKAVVDVEEAINQE